MRAFNTTPGADCYVIGCIDEATVCRTHKRFGNVASCLSHDPIRQDMARELAPGAGPRSGPTPSRTVRTVPPPAPLDPQGMPPPNWFEELPEAIIETPSVRTPAARALVDEHQADANRRKLLEMF